MLASIAWNLRGLSEIGATDVGVKGVSRVPPYCPRQTPVGHSVRRVWCASDAVQIALSSLITRQTCLVLGRQTRSSVCWPLMASRLFGIHYMR
jgi:hypothetical protein